MLEGVRPASRQEILVVDDSPVQATMLRRSLTHRGYQVAIAKHGQDGLARLRERRAALVITDVQMPVMNGYELCAAIKSDQGMHTIPVLLLTTLADPVDLMQGLISGADSYLTKPYDENVLVSRVEELLDMVCKAQNEGETEVQFAGAPLQGV